MLVRRVSRHVLLVPTSHSPRISRVRQPSGWSEALDHYAFRLFLRRAIQKSSGFVPEEVTQYVKPAKATALAESLVGLGLAAKVSAGRYRLLQPSRSFGGTLEWYVARGAASAVRIRCGRRAEVPGSWRRWLLRPDVTLFVMDTALRPHRLD
jgi:hypothetical protein